MVKLFFRILIAVFLLLVWSVIYAKIVQFIYLRIWGFDLFSTYSWLAIPDRWGKGWVIDTPEEFFFFFGMLLIVIVFVIGYIIVVKLPYVKIVTWPFRKLRDNRRMEKRRRQDAFPGIEKMISDLQAKKGKGGKISKSKMPPPMHTVSIPETGKNQPPLYASKTNKERGKAEKDILDSFKTQKDETLELPKRKTAPEYTDYSGFREDDYIRPLGIQRNRGKDGSLHVDITYVGIPLNQDDVIEDDEIDRCGWFSFEELNDIVILKIDTKGLNHNKLLCRTLQPREKFLEMAFSDKFQKFEPMVNKMLEAGKSEDEILFAVLNEVSPSMAHELFRGIPAQFSKLFKQQKKLIEFLYTQDIPMDKVEKIGSVVKSSDINSANPVRKFLEKLLEGAPEQKAIEFLTV